jgi:hypothetical protein
MRKYLAGLGLAMGLAWSGAVGAQEGPGLGEPTIPIPNVPAIPAAKSGTPNIPLAEPSIPKPGIAQPIPSFPLNPGIFPNQPMPMFPGAPGLMPGQPMPFVGGQPPGSDGFVPPMPRPVGPGEPMPIFQGGGMPNPAMQPPPMPPYAWPTVAPYNNFSRVAYPTLYNYEQWPFIGPFYPFPRVPMGWRSVSLTWQDGHWWYGRNATGHDWWRIRYW